ncbi:MAG: F420-0--gamma-glutamyl ligase [Clostridia bacterium]|nr:F420-0--gamma-glutamyl ligase [Clostridia bacterium]
MGEKQAIIEARGQAYLRIPVRTHVLTAADRIEEVVAAYALPLARPGDIIFISEKAVAATQGRAIPLEKIRPGFWARLLCRFVRKVSYGIGLGIPETMEMAIREVGLWRILLAAFIGALGKLLGRRGDFYRVAGRAVAAIDGPTPYTLPPYNTCVVLGPKDPEKVACRIAAHVGLPVAIVDINDLGGTVLGASPGVENDLLVAILRDNPLGQGAQQTPIGLIRAVSAAAVTGVS